MLLNSVIVCLVLGLVKSAKILVVVPSASISHQLPFRPLVQELVNRGHEVTYITTDPMYPQDKSPNNLKEIDLHDFAYGLFHKMIKTLLKPGESDALSVMTLVFKTNSRIFGEILKYPPVHKLITDKTVKFDLLIVEACVTPNLIFSHIFKAPLIQMSSFGATPGNMEWIGAAIHPILYPTHYREKLYNLTTAEKFIELHSHYAMNRMLEDLEVDENKMLQTIFGPNIPSLNELKRNIHMLFLNVHPIWLHGQPVPPNVIFTWGIHKIPEKKLPEDLQSYLDSSTNGVIYISFGTNVKSSVFTPERLKTMLNVLSQLPYNVLWKWDSDELPGKSDNIKISKWYPQVDVLRHPNLKLFITQGGLQSTDEAINAGVPLIGFPMFADQFYNTAKYEYFKIGKQLDFKSFTEEDLKMTIMNIFGDYESYRGNILKLRSQMKDMPMPPLENAVWWTEYVLRHGGAQHLRTPAANMPWTEYYELELVIIVLTGLIVLGALLIITVYSVYKYLSRTLCQRNQKPKLS